MRSSNQVTVSADGTEARTLPEVDGEALRSLEDRLAHLLWAALEKIGWLHDGFVPSPRYGRWRESALQLLKKQGIAPEEASEGWEQAWEKWRSYLQTTDSDRILGPQIQLLDVALQALPAVLTGERLATEVLFPRGNLGLVEQIYTNNPIADYFNDILAQDLRAYVHGRLQIDANARLRILEIGAGTGGTSKGIFEQLASFQAQIEEYNYTDVSIAFLARAQEQFLRIAPYLRTQRLDIERSPALQGLSAGSYDVVVAANVLHATTDIRLVLRHTKTLLKRNGLLLANELSGGPNLCTHLTFGLLEGWWSAKDSGLRVEGSPALNSESWKLVLQGEGFERVEASAKDAQALGQQILVAWSDGVMRLEPEAKPASRSTQRSVTEDAAPAIVETRTVGTESDASFATRVERVLGGLITQQMKVPVEALEPDTPLSDYGFDSITLGSFAHLLNERYGLELSPTVFYQMPTIEKLAAYLVQEHRSNLSTNFSLTRDVDGRRKANGEAEARVDRKVQSPPIATRVREVSDPEPIAVVGISGCFPGAPNIDTLWVNLEAGRDCIGELPPSRWCNQRGPAMRHAGVIEGIEYFDPLFFGISPREARGMDPQQRLLMQHVYWAIEDAGYSVQSLSDSETALLVGTITSGYGHLLAESGEPVDGYTAAGLAGSMGPNRMSYWLDWHGPSEPIDTACSSSLVAIHRAVGLLRSGQCEQAIAGGINTLLSIEAQESLLLAGMLSPKGRCQTFSARADGFVRAEGVGMLFLKPLKAAERDGDHIYGLIVGTAENHGGRAASLTAPNPVAQARVIEMAFRQAGINPRMVNYIEAHGTGTVLGDPIEIQGLRQAFQALTDGEFLPVASCGLGTIKSNIGHLELAAGVAGVIKVLLQMKHRQLVASINSEPRNSHIDLRNSPFYVVDQKQRWEALKDEQGAELPRRAGVSSFGFGGVNAHVVLEEYIRPQREVIEVTGPVAVILSARNQDRLREQVRRLLTFLEDHEVSLGDLAYTLQVGREALGTRLALIVSGLDELRKKLTEVQAGAQRVEDVYQGEVKRGQEALAVFKADEELDEAINKWVARGKIGKLAEIWAQGLAVDWAALYKEKRPQRLSLPTYPFARERYWIGETDDRVGSAKVEEMVEADSDVVCLQETWQPAPPEKRSTDNIGTVAYLISDAAESDVVIEALATGGMTARAVFLVQGEEEASSAWAAELYWLGWEPDEERYVAALSAINRRYGTVDAIVCLSSLLTRRDFIAETRKTLELVRAIKRSGAGCRRLLLLGHSEDDLRQAQLESWIGIERSVGSVLPQTRINVVFERAKEPTPLKLWIERLVCELTQSQAVSAFYLEGERHTSRVNLLKLEARPRLLEQGGTYWITGGCGGLGRLFARYLAEQYQANLVLSGRGTLDPVKAEFIAELERLGASVLYGVADVVDGRAMAALLVLAKERFGRVDGVIHAAGLSSKVSVTEGDWGAFSQVLAPKMHGIEVLDRILVGEPVKVICYFSSIAAALGDFGGCAYAMANRFMVAYARRRQARLGSGEPKRRTLAISWPIWRAGGMQLGTTEQSRLYLSSSGQRVLETGEALKVFERLLGQTQADPIVVVGEPERMQRMVAQAVGGGATNGSIPHLKEKKVNQSCGVGYRAEMKGWQLEECILWDLGEQASEVLNLPREELEPGTNLAEYGFDSIGLTEYARRLSRHYGLEIVASTFFNFPTLKQLGRYLEESFGEKFADFYRPSSQPPLANGLTKTTPSASAAVDCGADTKNLSDDKTTDDESSRVEREFWRKPLPSIAGRETKADRRTEPIAIIGMSGRFPGARTIEEFWTILSEGRCVVEAFPYERVGTSKDALDLSAKLGAMPGIEEFDPLFFEISPREAELIDPRQRLVLQEAWRALEDAGYSSVQLERQTVGIFVGVEQGDYKYLVGNQAGITSNHEAVLASRLAYVLNLNGPAMAINTACSSGLVALHEACQSLRTGESDTAIAAGVSMVLNPDALKAMEEIGMLAPDGNCYAFDQRAKGTTAGEAVVVLVLKRLTEAQADGDPIHALVVGSGINYDGKTQGITAPSGIAQARLLKNVYERHGIELDELDYIVTHGTGTVLGDAVELNGLGEAFKAYTEKRQFCALTSTKPNVGHTMAASGLVSLVSLVQAMRHQTIPASLNCERENEGIDWEKSPFYINKKAKPWPRRVDRARLGGVSAFGMSGTNAHVVVQSFDSVTPSQIKGSDRPGLVLLTLSAKTPEALQERKRELAKLLEVDQHLGDANLFRAMSFTLLKGRQHFTHRWATVVEDKDEALQVLQKQNVGPERRSNVFWAEVRRDFKAQKGLESFGESLIEKLTEGLEGPEERESLCSLADLYCQGYALSWERLFGAANPQRLHLPTYPFSRDRYWISKGELHQRASQIGLSESGWLHPLVHRNTSDLTEQRYTSVLMGNEFFLRDHLVQGRLVLPGAVQLEWVRSAISLAVGGGARIALEQIQWLRPVVVGAPTELHIGLEQESAADGRVRFELYSRHDDSEAVVVYSQGYGLIVHEQKDQPQLDLEVLKGQCQREIAGGELYKQIASLGVKIGPELQGLKRLYAGDGIAVSKLECAFELEGYDWRPELLDGALLTGAALLEGDGLKLPFAVAKVEQWGPMPNSVWAVSHFAKDDNPTVRKLDIAIVDEAGRMVLGISGYTLRAPEGAEVSESSELVLMVPQWKTETLPACETRGVSYGRHYIFLCEVEPGDDFEGALAPAICLRAKSAGTIDQRYTNYSEQLLKRIQGIVATARQAPVLLQVVVPMDQAVLQGLRGLLRSAQQEYPKLIAQVVAVESGSGLEAKLRAEAVAPAASTRYRFESREVLRFEEWEWSNRAEAAVPWYDEGIYWITGGLGGLGRLFADAIAKEVSAPVLILTGRRSPSSEQNAFIDGLRSQGAHAEYRALDVSDRLAMRQLVRDIVRQYGRLSGVLHTAGVLRDRLLAGKTVEELQEVLRPKVAGMVALDEATQDVALDWMVAFSAITGVLGNLGQTDYAAANAFVDQYAEWRQTLVDRGERHGRTVSLSWPQWADGGMQLESGTLERMSRGVGLALMPTQAGLSAVRRALAEPRLSHVVVLYGERKRLVSQTSKVYEAPPWQQEAKSFETESMSDEALVSQVEPAIVNLISFHLKLPLEALDRKAPLSQFGFDSINLTTFSELLRERYGLEVSPATFFEAPTIEELSAYLVREHRAVLAKALTGKGQTSKPVGPAQEPKMTPSHSERHRHRKVVTSESVSKERQNANEPVAIVGMSGCFPQAPDIGAFWKNLEAGRDCIGELPVVRWVSGSAPEMRNAGVLDEIDCFDPLFFGISPREAQGMDPQQRLLMLYVHKAIEDAGYSVESLSGSMTALLVGTMGSGYGVLLAQAGEPIEGQSTTGLAGSMGPNRMSYWLNWHGPSEPVDTACSSSLVAIHRAVSLLRSGQCAQAVAGGVNTILSPEVQESMAKAGMLSAVGRCQTFSAQADGYVRGEGVGMLFLKLLSAAERDGDHIYGLILASAENHGGRATSLTAPNPAAQARLIEMAFRQAEVDPSTIGYMEAHGTGTPLGDPIEVQGLKQAFRLLTNGERLPAASCGIGSVKSNIGHLELAAGVAGVIKVLLQIEHRQLVPTIHSEPLSPHIDLSDSPFYVVKEKRTWEALKDRDGTELPRRAGVSSFGFGGVNAHVVLQEYVAPPQAVSILRGPVAVVLSARNEERLKEQVSQLLIYLEQYEVNLIDLAYTLQLGRDALGVRLALVVNSIDELKERLRQVQENQLVSPDIYLGEVKRNQEALAAFNGDEELQEAISKWMVRGKIGKLAELWVQGLVVNWAALYSQTKPQRLSLPTYPFARERHWVPQSNNGSVSSPKVKAEQLHPLVHRNRSDLDRTRYSTLLTGDEFYLHHYLGEDRRLVPEAVLLEWARGTLRLAAGGDVNIQLDQLSWRQTMTIDKPTEIQIALAREEDGRISYEFYSQDSNDSPVTVYAQGCGVEQCEPGKSGETVLDLTAFKGQCHRTLTGAEIYQRLEAMGLRRDVAMRGLKALHLGEKVALAELELSAGQEVYNWPPGLLDGALASAGVVLEEERPGLSFIVESVQQSGAIPRLAWAIIRSSSSHGAASRKLDVTVVDEAGRTALLISGTGVDPTENPMADYPSLETTLLIPEWKAEALPDPSNTANYDARWIFLCEVDPAPTFESAVSPARCVRLGIGGTIDERFTSYAERLLKDVQEIVASRPKGAVLLQLVVPASAQILRGLSGLLRTAQLEYPALITQTIVVESVVDLDKKLTAEASLPAWTSRYGSTGREVLSFREWPSLDPDDRTLPWRDEGVYWITGGLGSLGQLFARRILEQVTSPVLVLSGRSAVATEQARLVEELRRRGARIEYRPVDVADRVATRELVQDIVLQYGYLHGVIHSAGVVKDRLVPNKLPEELQQVLRPKVAGLSALDEATHDIPLDWLLLCSSTASLWGSVGQSDYAAGNAFMDEYAQWRQTLVEKGERHGKTVALNWPQWAEGGMRMDSATRERIWKAIGLVPLPNEVGLDTLSHALVQVEASQVVVLYGDRHRLLATMERSSQAFVTEQVEPSRVETAITPAERAADESLSLQVERAVTALISVHLKIPVESLNRDTPLSEFGFDSMTLTTFGDLLNQRYDLQLVPSVFYAAPTIGSLAKYLVEEHSAQLAKSFTATTSSVRHRSATTQSEQGSRLIRRTERRTVTKAPRVENFPSAIEPVAVIGMSGRFPQAGDIEAFWDNLEHGRDCIGTLPRNRWGNSGEYLRSDAGVIEGIDWFDPLFFGISPREARGMDPQQRLLMEYVYRVVEDAGYSVSSLSGSATALLVGTNTSGYWPLWSQSGQPIDGYTAIGLTGSMGPNRMSYWLNWHGPSEMVDTACSSSLVAIHRAVHLLRSGQCEQAVAGGINTILSGEAHESMSKAGMLSERGRCRTFSAQADGYVRGEGVAMLFLKPLQGARRDRDHIYGLILGSAENHGGKATSLTAPNPVAQARLIESAIRQSGIDPATIGYIEAHGTGTPLGDPIEIEGLKEALKGLARGKESASGSCGLGSVKSNIGHLELAAGVAGMVKVLLQMKHRRLVATINSEPPNPQIDLGDSPFYVVKQAREWEAIKDESGRELPRRAGISSFGFGGVNAHLVLEEYIEPQQRATEVEGMVAVVLSARTEDRLKEQVKQLRGYIQKHEVNLADLAYTLQVGREGLGVRLALIVSSVAELREKLDHIGNGKLVVENVYRGEIKRSLDSVSLFKGDEELEEAIGKWLAKGKIDKIAELWVQGMVIDWAALYRETKPRRLSLPTYPFARERYWVPEQPKAIAGNNRRELSQSVGMAMSKESPPSLELPAFQEVWRVEEAKRSEAKQAQTVIFVIDELADAIEIERAMPGNARPARIIFLVESAVEPEAAIGGGVYWIGLSPGWERYSRAFGAIKAHYGAIDGLVYLGALSRPKLVAEPSAILDLLQAVKRSELECRRVLLVAHCSDDSSQAHLESWIGIERSLGLVLPETRVSVVGERAVERPTVTTWLTRLTDELGQSQAESVFYLDGKRQVCRIEPVSVGPDESLLERGGTYWITGGCGGLGTSFARYLAERYQANLVLSGREGLDKAKEELISELESLGASVVYGSADVTDRRAMLDLLERAKRRFGPIDGVIHAAGIISEVSLFDSHWEAFSQVLAPKVQGTEVLEEVLRTEPLKSVCYFSSTSAVLGDFGACAYAMGNRFLLAYARIRQARVERGEVKGRTVAIAWPLWADGGMGRANAEQTRLYLKSSGQRALETREGLALFERFLAGGVADPLVVTGEAERMRSILSRAIVGGATSVSAQPVEETDSTGAGHRVELKGLSLEECILWDLSEQAGQVVSLGREELEPETNLAEYGFDSIGLAEYARRLSRHYGLEIVPSIFFSYPSLGTLQAYLQETYGQTLVQFYEQERKSVSANGSTVAVTARANGETLDKLPGREAGLKKEQRTSKLNGREPIAIIGMSGRFPGARTIKEFWRILSEGRSVVKPFPGERLGKSDEELVPSVKLGAMPGIEEFDPLFFEISPRDAKLMDPRQRLLLQEAWRALEDGGLGSEQLETQTVGMFVGVEQGDYQYLAGNEGGITANHDAILAARLAYVLNLNGPTMAINTACSSGLVALHQACQSLRSGESTTAIAAGVSLVLSPTGLQVMAEIGMLSPDGICHAFDQTANGTAAGEAVVAVVLKTLSQAQADGDPIHALIVGSGINYDGKTQGITAPSGIAQVRLLRSVYERHAIDPNELDYIVTHGTGTVLGDAVELGALAEALKGYTAKLNYCALTSNKPNVGHTLAASGLVSLVSLVEAMRHETIPGSVNCDRENESVDWSKMPFFINKQAKAWPRRIDRGRLGAVSAFGMSGTNAHVVVRSVEVLDNHDQE